MKKYLAFSGECYYPGGGWEDFKGDFDNITEAFTVARKDHEKYGWWHVIDRDTQKEVEEVTIESHIS